MNAANDTTAQHLAELNLILDSQFIDEVGITLDTSLPPIFYTEGKLGIAKSILKSLFKYSLEFIYRLKKIETTDAQICKDALSISRIVLLIKGDFPVAFDMRKKLIQMNMLSIQDEISFTSLLYTRHPKCPSGWHHRRWCLLRNLKSSNAVLSAAEIETERELCRVMAEKHSKNYYAWMHRLWILKYMSRFQLEDELFFTKTWLQSHVSDHSAVNHRVQVVRHILSQPDTLLYIAQNDDTTPRPAEFSSWVTFLQREFSESEELVCSRPGHEALWYLRRSLLELLFTKASESETVRSSLAGLGKQTVSALDIAELSLGLSPEGPADDFEVKYGTTTSHISANILTTASDNSLMSPLVWLTSLLSREMRLARRCATDTAAWDYPAQRAMAARYAAYLLDRALHYTSDDASGASGERGPSGIGHAEGLADPILDTDRVLTLEVALADALQRVCATLQSEDSFARIWDYKARTS